MSDRIIIGFISGAVISVMLMLYGIVKELENIPNWAKTLIGLISLVFFPLGFVIMIGTILYSKYMVNETLQNSQSSTQNPNSFPSQYGEPRKKDTEFKGGIYSKNN